MKTLQLFWRGILDLRNMKMLHATTLFMVNTLLPIIPTNKPTSHFNPPKATPFWCGLQTPSFRCWNFQLFRRLATHRNPHTSGWTRCSLLVLRWNASWPAVPRVEKFRTTKCGSQGLSGLTEGVLPHFCLKMAWWCMVHFSPTCFLGADERQKFR